MAQVPEMVMQGLAAVGLAVLIRAAYSVMSFIYVSFLRPAKNLKKLGAWAVVTGSTDGIGKELAKQLGKKGFNVVLVGRTPSKLTDAKAEVLEKAPGIEVKEIKFDFASATKADYDRITKELSALEIGVLYNNVGVSYDHAEVLEDLSDEKIEALIEVNNRSMVKMTRIVLPGMVSRRKGAIINIGSFAGSTTDPFYSVYSGSKAFVEMFSKSMAVELKSKGVTVADHVPLFVATKMAIPNEKRRKGTLFTPWPAQWAAASLRNVGYSSFVVPYWPHALQASFATSLPAFVWDKLRYDMNATIRKIALKKKQQ
mmetsp:Transcript_15062/g.29693  ORF Transcript_15062/g.29693 Transcript_15062/m.29693 type:complete len:313 (-) Transcript_15062:13-951(-)|eukprot:CAMPEP_0173386874 /NCGR_PEP_ID=MMETSP1356-20130122/9458_1 /TAXON_ID=77927 ORGANISM="Hemiselmis virescens, Strain PCC157" /NCGR_SAMPLE_ID=MMETSP1356 /ASSEMBLY_ACC=CAM_ASM_000847 /LENGTH=312 /DNA_ID=CAMNT_0014343287 /DNA_START=38 /DNA_END=976 /DNA_ORIENTATION=-